MPEYRERLENRMTTQIKLSKIKTREFLNPEKLLKAIPLEPGMTVVDMGCGNGHYAVSAGTIVGSQGQVHALDILEEALSQTATLARLHGIHNVSTRVCNLELFGSCGLEEQSGDLVVMSGLLHQLHNKANAIREAYRLLKTGGRLLVVEWTKDSPFGPAGALRLDEDETRELLEAHGFRPVSELPAGSFHYALLYAK